MSHVTDGGRLYREDRGIGDELPREVQQFHGVNVPLVGGNTAPYMLFTKMAEFQ